MTSDLSNFHRECSPYCSYSLFHFERSDVISVLKNSIEYSFVFFKCLVDLKCKFANFDDLHTVEEVHYFPAG